MYDTFVQQVLLKIVGAIFATVVRSEQLNGGTDLVLKDGFKILQMLKNRTRLLGLEYSDADPGGKMVNEY